MIQHILIRKPHTYGPDKLFHPSITGTHVTLMEVDYNVHKSNSTYFADLDVARTHLVSHLFASGIRKMNENARTRLVLDPSDPTRPAPGRFGVMLGAVQCSFKREIKPYQKYEMWTRVLSWDRKWMYMVTYFVEASAVRPRSWAAPGSRLRTRSEPGVPQDWEKKVFATALSKYVFKMGRLTIHPAVLMDASGLLPERPGGWVTAESSGDAIPAENSNGNANGHANGTADLGESGWDWRKTEAERQNGWEFAQHFAALDSVVSQFDGGEDGALQRFSLG
jgi:acyl-CoA thioesterase FadM